MKTSTWMLCMAWTTCGLLAGCDKDPTSSAGQDTGSQEDSSGDAVSEDTSTEEPTPEDTAPDASDDTDTHPRIPEEEAAEGRNGCAFERGAMAWETVGEEYPIGTDIPIDHFILLMQENRSFDHYFGAMPGVEGIPENASNPSSGGDPVAPYHETDYCIRDVAHSWNASHIQYNEGLNDGFVITNDPAGERAMGYYTDADLPFYWDLYSTFAMSDHHHCSVLGPTWINRWYYLSGTSFGMVHNDPLPGQRLTDPPYVIFQELDDADIDWRIYYSDVPFALTYTQYYVANRTHVTEGVDEFFDDLAAGDIPPVVYIDPSFTHGVTQTDEHPPSDPQYGQQFVAEIVNAVMNSDIWSSTAIIITYDEHGGYYDHVPPPEACPPGDFEADLLGGDFEGQFDRLGFRVPLAVISPYSKANYVSDRVTDASSIIRLLETRFLLPAMTSRDANAWPLLDMFDFENPPYLDPPDLEEAVIDAERAADCAAEFGE